MGTGIVIVLGYLGFAVYIFNSPPLFAAIGTNGGISKTRLMFRSDTPCVFVLRSPLFRAAFEGCPWPSNCGKRTPDAVAAAASRPGSQASNRPLHNSSSSDGQATASAEVRRRGVSPLRFREHGPPL